MRKTLFAGLTVLTADESLVADDGAFIGRDRDTIDRLLEIGAKTHRHDGTAGLSSPSSAVPAAEAIPSGGTLDPSTTFTVAYTLEDDENGETLASPVVSVTTQPPLAFPELAPTAVIDYDNGGSLLVDTYYYGITYVDEEGGETPIGAAASVEREPGFANARVLLSGLNDGLAGASAVAWRLYRAVGGGTFGYLSSGAGDAFTDDGSVPCDCDIHPPPDEVNTTNAISQLRVVLPSPEAVGEAALINLYGSVSGELIGDVLLGSYPASSAGQTVFFTDFDPGPGMPPDTNLSIGGASKIDPDTEILDWHWKRPVANPGLLPDGELGDVRLATGNGVIYGMLLPSGTSGQWTALGSGAVGGSDAHDILQVRASGDGSKANPTSIIFASSGATQVAVADVGGSARVMIYTPPGGGGGGGSALNVTDGVEPVEGPFIDLGQITFPEAFFFLSEDTPGGVNVEPKWPVRAWGSGTSSATIASGGVGFATPSFRGDFLALALSTDKRCRIRVYVDEAKRLADINRAPGVEPTGDHGCLLDYMNTGQAGGDLVRLAPQIEMHSLEDLENGNDYGSGQLPISITNYEADDDVTVAFLYLPSHPAF